MFSSRAFILEINRLSKSPNSEDERGGEMIEKSVGEIGCQEFAECD